MSLKERIIEKSCLLQDILEDSKRLSPLSLLLLDDLNSQPFSAPFLRHLISRHSKNTSKSITLLLLQDSVEQFYQRYQIAPSNNLQIVSNITIDSLEQLRSDVTSKLLSHCGTNVDNVLVISAFNELYLRIPTESSSKATKQMSKSLCQWLNSLQSHFSQIVIHYHTDAFPDFDDCQRYNEFSLRFISNAIIDFRLNNKCTLWDHSVHTEVTAKKKHPHTHLKVETRHEHFQLSDSGAIQFIREQSILQALEKKNESKFQPEVEDSSLPQSTFNLGLKKDEQEAKDSLVLPYIKKNTTNSVQQHQQSSGSRIIYNYDQFDDVDDEDPDDDLDF